MPQLTANCSTLLSSLLLCQRGVSPFPSFLSPSPLAFFFKASQRKREREMKRQQVRRQIVPPTFPLPPASYSSHSCLWGRSHVDTEIIIPRGGLREHMCTYIVRRKRERHPLSLSRYRRPQSLHPVEQEDVFLLLLFPPPSLLLLPLPRPPAFSSTHTSAAFPSLTPFPFSYLSASLSPPLLLFLLKRSSTYRITGCHVASEKVWILHMTVSYFSCKNINHLKQSKHSCIHLY